MSLIYVHLCIVQRFNSYSIHNTICKRSVSNEIANIFALISRHGFCAFHNYNLQIIVHLERFTTLLLSLFIACNRWSIIRLLLVSI